MDLADDVAYSVHDVEDGVVAGRIDLTRLDADAVWAAVRDWYLPEADRRRPRRRRSAGCARSARWPTTPYDGSRRSLAALKNLTSDLIGRFCAAAQDGDLRGVPTARSCATPPTWSCPSETAVEMAVLKGIAAHYVMRADDRVSAMARQRELLAELVEVLAATAPGRPRPAVRRRLGGRRRRRRAAPGRGRPGRLAHRRQRRRLARPARLRSWAERGLRAGRPAGPRHVVRARSRDVVRRAGPPCPWRPRGRAGGAGDLVGHDRRLVLGASTACWVFSCTRGSCAHLVDRAHDLVVALAAGPGAQHVAHARTRPAASASSSMSSLLVSVVAAGLGGASSGSGCSRCSLARVPASRMARPARDVLLLLLARLPDAAGVARRAAGAPPRRRCRPGAGARARARSRARRRTAGPGW